MKGIKLIWVRVEKMADWIEKKVRMHVKIVIWRVQTKRDCLALILAKKQFVFMSVNFCLFFISKTLQNIIPNPVPKIQPPTFQSMLPLKPNKNYCGIIINYLENDFPRKASLSLRLELHPRSLRRPRRSLHRKSLIRTEPKHSQEYPSHLSQSFRSVPC